MNLFVGRAAVIFFANKSPTLDFVPLWMLFVLGLVVYLGRKIHKSKLTALWKTLIFCAVILTFFVNIDIAEAVHLNEMHLHFLMLEIS